MTQQELELAVAKATGEDAAEIRRHGFSLVEPDDDNFDPEPDLRPPQIIDWDEYDLRRNVSVVEQPCGAAHRRCELTLGGAARSRCELTLGNAPLSL